MRQPATDTRAAQLLALRLASPKRADTGRPIAPQDDASALALFEHALQPRLL